MGIRGPNFVWSAVGPALEESATQWSKRQRVKGVLSVKEFLEHVRRIVVDFVVSRAIYDSNRASWEEELSSLQHRLDALTAEERRIYDEALETLELAKTAASKFKSATND